MPTSCTDINDLFLTRINDYRITSIYLSSGSSGLNTYLEPWLLDSIIEFDVCNQTLNYTLTSGSVEGTFDTDLTLENKLILSLLMVKYWLAKEIRDVLQMQNVIQDKDYKTYSQAQNLTAKQNFYSSTQEELSQRLVNYGYKNNNWTNWKNQNFG